MNGSGMSESLLQVRGIDKRYAAPVLIDLDLDLRGGDIHALMGANGAGIDGIVDPDHLAVLIGFRLQRLKDPLPGPIRLPDAEPVVAGRARRIAFGQISPRRSRS